jgi:hypothetical protein
MQKISILQEIYICKFKIYYKVVKVTLTKNTTLQKMEQLNLIECNYIRN